MNECLCSCHDPGNPLKSRLSAPCCALSREPVCDLCHTESNERYLWCGSWVCWPCRVLVME